MAGTSRVLLTYSLLFLLIMDLVAGQSLEKILLTKGLFKLARIKAKGKDKKVIIYGLGAVKKAGKGTIEGIIGKPIKKVGFVLGPLGLPLKLIGTILTTKSVVHKGKAVVLTIKKYSRDSIRYGI